VADSTALSRRIASDEFSGPENQPFSGGDMVELMINFQVFINHLALSFSRRIKPEKTDT